jgi:F-box/leucine-rich repeat protein 2/20
VQHIRLNQCQRVTDCGVCGLVSSLASNLRCVILYSCPRVTDAVLLALADHCPRMERISWGRNMSDSTMIKLAEGCSELRHLSLSSNAVGDAGVLALAAHSNKLQTLYLHNCRNVTIHGARAVAEHCRLLVDLLLSRQLEKEHVYISQPAAPSCNVRYV